MAGRELQELLVADAEELRDWLARHHEDSPGVWLVLGRKGGSVTSLTWQQAVDEALCVGWIDGQARKRDEASYVNGQAIAVDGGLSSTHPVNLQAYGRTAI